MTEIQGTQETHETTETTVEKPVLSDPAEEKRISVSEPAKETTETTTETTTSAPADTNR